MPPPNPYFELTDAFNAEGRIALMASGPPVVYRLALTSRDDELAEEHLPSEVSSERGAS